MIYVLEEDGKFFVSYETRDMKPGDEYDTGQTVVSSFAPEEGDGDQFINGLMLFDDVRYVLEDLLKIAYNQGRRDKAASIRHELE